MKSSDILNTLMFWLCRFDVRKGFAFPSSQTFDVRGYASDSGAAHFLNLA